jgi:CsoR family transcriptional regulator, copper-sensing transcriptional repressor
MQKEHLSENKEKALLSTKKALGTLQKVLEMIENDKYCPEVIQQVEAAIGLLRSTKKNLLSGHLDHCLEEKLHQNKKQTVDELMRIFDLGGR